MAWKDELLDCSFRGVTIDVIDTHETLSRAVSIAEYPYQDGGSTEDLGARPMRIAINAVFFGDDYKARLDKFLKVVGEPGSGELIHPIWGSIEKAQAGDCEIIHNAPEPDSCTVRLSFTEDSPERPFFEKSGAGQASQTVGAAGDSAVDSAINVLTDAVDMLRELNPLAALEDLRHDMLGPLLAFSAQAQGIVGSGLDMLAFPRAWARDISSLASGILGAGSFGDNLLGDWRSISGVFSSLGARFGFGGSDTSSAGSASSFVTPQPGAKPTEAQASAVAQTTVSVICATSTAEAAAAVLVAESTTPTLSPQEIETIVDAARSTIEAAIEIARICLPLEQSRTIVEPLKVQALALQEAARAVIEMRPPLLARRIAAPGNLRLIAHLWYGDHSRAPELWRLNPACRLPNNLQPGDTLNAYSR